MDIVLETLDDGPTTTRSRRGRKDDDLEEREVPKKNALPVLTTTEKARRYADTVALMLFACLLVWKGLALAR